MCYVFLCKESRSDVASEASSYTYDNTPRVQPTRRLFLSEEDEGTLEDDVGSEDLYGPDEQDSAILAGRHDERDFRNDARMMGLAKSGGALGALLDKPTAVSDDRLLPASTNFGRPAVPGKLFI